MLCMKAARRTPRRDPPPTRTKTGVLPTSPPARTRTFLLYSCFMLGSCSKFDVHLLLIDWIFMLHFKVMSPINGCTHVHHLVFGVGTASHHIRKTWCWGLRHAKSHVLKIFIKQNNLKSILSEGLFHILYWYPR